MYRTLPTPPNTLLQRPNHRIKIRLKEERHTDPPLAVLSPIASVNDTMHSALPQPVRPPLNHVPDVDDKGTRDRVRGQPSAVFELDLQSAGCGIGKQESYASVVCMCATRELAQIVIVLVAGRQYIGRFRRGG